MQRKNHKVCNICEQYLESKEFPKNKGTCKKCYYAKNRELYRQKKQEEREKKQIALKNEVVPEFFKMSEKIKKLEEKLTIYESIVNTETIIKITESQKALQEINETLVKAAQALNNVE